MKLLPRKFGRYYLFEKIATGGMAEVYKAKLCSAHNFEMILVIKQILPQLAANEKFVEMFVDEAKISVNLRHQNIVQLYDFGRENENYFIAMEFVEGRDLKSLLAGLSKKRKFIPINIAVLIAQEVLKGLDYAHRKRDQEGRNMDIVHRDINPSNILISTNGEVKVTDFGIAKAKNKMSTTLTGAIKGKYEYMSPEQASGEGFDHRSDIFSVGIVLHEMLTGRRLFRCKSEIETLEKIRKQAIPRPTELNSRVPVELDELIMKALSKDITGRPASAKSMHLELEDYLMKERTGVRESLSDLMHEVFSDDFENDRLKDRKEAKRIRTLMTLDAENKETQAEIEPKQNKTNGSEIILWGQLLVIIVLIFVHFWRSPNNHGQLHVQVDDDASMEIDGTVHKSETELSLENPKVLKIRKEGRLIFTSEISQNEDGKINLKLSYPKKKSQNP